MGIDQLIDQTFPSLPPHPSRSSTYSTSNAPTTPLRAQRPGSSYSAYGKSVNGSIGARGTGEEQSKREREREASSSTSGITRDSVYTRGQYPHLLRVSACGRTEQASTLTDLASPPNRPVSQTPSSPASKFKSFFRSSSSNKINAQAEDRGPQQSTSTSTFASPSSYSTRSRTTTSSSNRTLIPSTSDVYTSPPPSAPYNRNLATPATRNRMSILESSLPISPATRGDLDHVGKSPSRPVTPSSTARSDGLNKKKERTRSGKNMSIWSLSPSVLGGGGSSAASFTSRKSRAEEDDGASIASRSRQGSIVSNGARPQSSLSCISAVSPPSPPLQAHLFRPSTPQRHSTHSALSSYSSPPTARPSLSPSHSANSVYSQEHSRSLSTSSSSSQTPNPTPPRLRKKPSLGETAMKAISSLMIRNTTQSSHDNSRRRTGSGGLGGNEDESEELTEEELLSWKKKKQIGLSVSSMEKLGCYDMDDLEGDGFGEQRRRRKSSNRSFLGGNVSDGIGLGMRDTEEKGEGDSDSDDGELLIIDQTKSKGFSTLLGKQYDEFVPSFSPPPHNTAFLLPSTAEVSPTSQPVSQFASPATLRPPTSKAQKRLSQNSTNSSVGSDEALWLDASNTNSFPSSPLAPHYPTTPQPGEKEVKRSAFSESLTHPSPIPTPPSPARRRRSSMIPLSPKVAQELANAPGIGNGVEEVWTTLPMPTSPHLVRTEKIEFTPPPSPPMSEREQGGATDGVFRHDPYL
ncbi:hypothetical protein JCM5353_008769 [Sporobolomyces roseus]